MSGRPWSADPAEDLPRASHTLRNVVLVLLGLFIGAIAGLFIANWVGWVPGIAC